MEVEWGRREARSVTAEQSLGELTIAKLEIPFEQRKLLIMTLTLYAGN